MADAGSPALDDRSPVSATAAVLGRKWHPIIVLRLLEEGPLGFSALEARVDGVSRKVLSESLSDLQEKGVVERTVLAENPTRVEYSLTDRGRALEAPVDEFRRWGTTYLREAADADGPPQ